MAIDSTLHNVRASKPKPPLQKDTSIGRSGRSCSGQFGKSKYECKKILGDRAVIIYASQQRAGANRRKLLNALTDLAGVSKKSAVAMAPQSRHANMARKPKWQLLERRVDATELGR